MADKTMPDERNRRPDADAPGAAGASGDASVARTSDSAAAASQDGNERVDAPAPPLAKAAAPLITAVEIENFKGIGRPMRVEFRPITLLFGNNSAGKSTVLHALCYAHEILSHRDVDVHRTEIGGDRVDLGGFLNFIHAHDPVRTVRLRFELNLENWRVPRALDEKIVSPFDSLGGDADGYLFGERSPRPKTGWLELHVESGKRQPVLASYELGVNDSLVGRLHARRPTGVALEFSPAHPLLEWARHAPQKPLIEQEGDVQIIRPDPQPVRIREAPESETDGWQQSQIAVLGLATPLPYWNELLVLDPHELARSVSDDDQAPEFEALASALFVGIGQALRDELASVRYIGPTRDLHPATTIASGTTAPASWADGSAAWTYLHDRPRRDLLDEVSAWLAREDRLDTGYELRAQNVVTIFEESSQLVPAMREYQRLREAFGTAEQSVDLDQWARKEARTIVETVVPYTPRALEQCNELRTLLSSAADGVFVDELTDDLDREAFRALSEELQFDGTADLKAGIRTAAKRNIELLDSLRQGLSSWSVDSLESQIKESAKAAPRSAVRLTPEHCRRLNDTLDEWKRAAPRQLWRAGVVHALRTAPKKKRREHRDRTHRLEESVRKSDISIKIERLVAELQDATRATVEKARVNYQRLATLVSKMETRDFTRQEVDDLFAAMAVDPTRRLQIVTTKSGLPVRTSDVGVGISQLLPVVVAALDPDRPGITAIEQPELHLHPRLQVELGDLFAQPVDDGRVFLLENHSEHLMLRLLRRIEETHTGELPEGKPPLKPDQVSALFLEQVDGEVRATRLRIDETGEFIDRWPHGFFRERAAELF
ncbi:MAG: AAA family ATPase [Acidobacteria bacterium]|nr:AAA family ATPase [Acidobacteriota bacterium]